MLLGLSRKQMLSEVRFAVTAWGILYLIMFGMLLVYRYNTHSYYIGQARKAQELAAGGGGGSSVKTEKVIRQVPRGNPLQQYEATIQTLTEELTKSHQSVLNQLETLNQYLGTLETWKESALLTQDLSMPSSPPTADVAPPLEHWQQLLSLTSLQDVGSDEELDTLFETALGEMNEALEEPSKLNWNQIQESLVENPVRGRRDSELECPSGGRRKRRKHHYPNAAYESDLQKMMVEMDDYFSKRNPGAGMRALSGDSRKQVEDEAIEKAGQMLQEIMSFVEDMEQRVALQQQQETDSAAVDNDTTAAAPSCNTDLELVTALVDAGLKAMAAHGDVREAIRQTTLEYDPQIKEDDLILDADLPLTTSSEQQASSTVNLRSVIETPLLLQAMDWIDDLVDVVGGYNDKLDQYLDSLPDDDDDENVGEVVVERLLRAAGLQEIDIQKVGEKIKLSPELQHKILEKYG